MPVARLCAVCGAPATVPCRGSCGAYAYCREAHAATAWLSHAGAECARLTVDVAAGPSLRATFPPWAADCGDDAAALCTVLQSFGVHRRGLWRRECPCGAAGPWGVVPDGDGDGDDGGWALPSALVPTRTLVATDRVPAPMPPSSWPELYAALRLPPCSPAALALDAAATLVHACALVGLATSSPDSRTPLCLDLVGARKELDALPCFAAALSLLPRAVDLLLLGPDVPRDLDGAAVRPLPALTLRFRRCDSYAAVLRERGGPRRAALAFAPNAGVACYPREWGDTLDALVELGAHAAPVLVVTDYTHEAARLAVAAATGRGLACTGCEAVAPNPFRRPASSADGGSGLPAYSNGFVAVLTVPPQQQHSTVAG